jgi:hypothetical protein
LAGRTRRATKRERILARGLCGPVLVPWRQVTVRAVLCPAARTRARRVVCGGLDGRLLALVRDASVQAALVAQSAGLVRVVAGVQVHGDVVGQRPQVVQTVQGRGEQRGVVAVGTCQDTPQWNPVPVRPARALETLFAAVDR